MAAADAYFSLKDSTKLASQYPVKRIPVFFSQALAQAAEAHREAVRTVLARLLPLFDDKTFLAGVRASTTTRIEGVEVRTKNAPA